MAVTAGTTSRRQRDDFTSPVSGAASAAPNSDAEAKRSAGAFANARLMVCSIVNGMPGRITWIEGGRSWMWRARIACAVGPVNGGSPASIS